MKVSANILTWNNRSTILKTLESIYYDIKDYEHEFVIVDNGSTDGTVDIINNWIVLNLSNNFKFIRNDENKGISVGKNQGIDNSVGEYVIMVDGDVVPVLNSLRMMVDWLYANKDKNALGAFPNKFSNTEDHAETFCDTLIGHKKYKCCCLYYGVFRRLIFDNGLRMSVEGEFGKPGYGWEDHDFFKRMQKAGIDQYVAYINNERGKYYHDINSSIRAMGHEEYQKTSRLRDIQFKESWENGIKQGSNKPSGRTRRVRRGNRTRH